MVINWFGELSGIESLCHLILIDKFETATISIPNPYNSDSILSLFIHAKKTPKISVNLINGTPYINCNITLMADILSLDENYDYSTNEALNMISSYARSYFEQSITEYLYKISKEYHSDIDNFGKYVIKNYVTWNDWVESNWLDNFENAFFNVNIDVNVFNGQLYTKI